jgi:hypothetical protein
LVGIFRTAGRSSTCPRRRQLCSCGAWCVEQAQGAIVRGFNILGEAVGGSVGFGQGKRAFLVREGSAENIDALLGGDSSLAHAINEQSTVVALQIPPVHFARFSGAEPAESESSALCQATVAVRHSALTDIMK